MSCDLKNLDRLREKILAAKPFLATLYKFGRNKQRRDVSNAIFFADQEQLATLLCVLHKVSINVIPIPKRELRRIFQSKHEPHLQKLKNIEFVDQLASGPRKDLVAYLKKFTYIYAILLYSLFNEK